MSLWCPSGLIQRYGHCLSKTNDKNKPLTRNLMLESPLVWEKGLTDSFSILTEYGEPANMKQERLAIGSSINLITDLGE